MEDKGCRDILVQVAKLEQKTEDLEDFVKSILLHKIEALTNKIDLEEVDTKKELAATREIVEKRFKWMLGLFVLFFVSIVIPLITLIIMVAQG